MAAPSSSEWAGLCIKRVHTMQWSCAQRTNRWLEKPDAHLVQVDVKFCFSLTTNYAVNQHATGQRWANNSVFEYIRIIWTEYIRIPNYSVLFKNRILFVFVFGWNFQTEYIRIRIRFKISNRIYSYSYSVRKKFEYYSNSRVIENITFERQQTNLRLTGPIRVGGSTGGWRGLL